MLERFRSQSGEKVLSAEQSYMLQAGYQQRLLGLLHIIPEGEKALTQGSGGKRNTVVGPRVIIGKMLIPYEKRALKLDERGWLYAADGTVTEVSGPNIIHIEPQGRLVLFRKIELTDKQACVIIGQDGKQQLIRGADMPIRYLNPEIERLRQFSWTGSGSHPDDEKVPQALRFEILRLDDTQTYFSFPVRTNDNAVLIVKLMIFYSISSFERLVSSGHDPLSGFYNKIQAGVTEKVSLLSFDEFKSKPAEYISGVQELSVSAFSESIGIDITRTALREWSPADPQVQKTLERAAVVQTEKELDRAGHERKMSQASYAEKELTEAKKLQDLQLDAAKQEGVREGQKLAAMFAEIGKSMNPSEAVALMKLHLASKANELNIGSDMLR